MVVEISLPALALAFIPVAFVVAILFAWRGDAGTSLYATGRMLLQLVLVGYVLNFIFASDSALVVALVLTVMLLAASWIALRPQAAQRQRLLPRALFAIGVSGSAVLLLISQFVLQASPWYDPRVLLPLGGMIFAGSMNAVSLCAERYQAEQDAGKVRKDARLTAFQAALIPVVNSMFAVGLVSLPGMMTGQILSGVPPLVAARYQIVVMCMLFGAAGISAALYLVTDKGVAR